MSHQPLDNLRFHFFSKYLVAAAVCKVFVEITSGPCGWSW